MSTLAILRPRGTSAKLTMRSVDPEAATCRDVRRAIDALDNGRSGCWRQVTPVGCEWDDLVNEVSGFGPAPSGSRLEVALASLAETSQVRAVWYPGDDFAELSVVHHEDEFATRIVPAVAGGDIEPGLRFVRRPTLLLTPTLARPRFPGLLRSHCRGHWTQRQ